MAEINLGNIRFNWRGIFQLDAEYIKNDVVSYKGSSYVAFKNCTSELPTNLECWDLMVEGIEDVSKIQQAYDLANGALPITGGTVTGETYFENKLFSDNKRVLNSDDLISGNLEKSGWCKQPNGLIIQWGYIETTWDTGKFEIKFPITFQTRCFSIIASYAYTKNDTAASNKYALSIRAVDNTKLLTIKNENGATKDIQWIAIGH